MSPPRPGRSLMPPGREAALVADSGFAALVPLASLRPSRRHPHHPPASRRGAPRSGAAALAGHQRPPPHQERAPVRSGRRGHAIDPRLATAVRRQGWLPVLPNLGAGALPWAGSSRKPCYAPARHGIPRGSSAGSSNVGRWMRSGAPRLYREVQARLGAEARRQWSDRAIARTTLGLLGVFFFSDPLASRSGPAEPPRGTANAIRPPTTHRRPATTLAAVRRHHWREQDLPASRRSGKGGETPPQAVKCPRFVRIAVGSGGPYA